MVALGPLIPRIHENEPLVTLARCERLLDRPPEPDLVDCRRRVPEDDRIVWTARRVVPPRGHATEALVVHHRLPHHVRDDVLIPVHAMPHVGTRNDTPPANTSLKLGQQSPPAP